jgi:hypothetical protein
MTWFQHNDFDIFTWWDDQTPDTFGQGQSQQIDGHYIEGISLTHGTYPRKHIWTFAAALHEIDNAHPAFLCSCIKQKCCWSTDNNGGCSPGEGNESCTYECRLLHEPPPEYNSSCEFIEANCADEYELLNYLIYGLSSWTWYPIIFKSTDLTVRTWFRMTACVKLYPNNQYH